MSSGERVQSRWAMVLSPVVRCKRMRWSPGVQANMLQMGVSGGVLRRGGLAVPHLSRSVSGGR